MSGGILRYPGGKTRAIKILESIVSAYEFDVSTVVSPFVGGASFELYLANNYDSCIIANDKFKPLYLFWYYMKDRPDRVIRKVKSLRPLSKEKFLEIRDQLSDSDVSHVRRAAYYFAVNRSSFSGSTTCGGYSREAAKNRFNANAVIRLSNLDLTDFTFHNMDFKEFLKTIPDKDTFLFVDPPYDIDSNLYGVDEDFNHKKLRDVLSTRNNWILCYNDNKRVRKLYKNIGLIISVSWAYSMNASKKSKEIVIIRHDGKVPNLVSLTDSSDSDSSDND